MRMTVRHQPNPGTRSRGLSRGVMIFSLVLVIFSLIPQVYGLEPHWIYPTGGQDIASMAISANGSIVAVGTTAGDVILLDRSGTELWRHTVPGSVLVAVPPDGSVVLAGNQEDHYKNKGAIRLYDQNGTRRWFINTGYLTGIGISADAKRIAAGVQTGEVFIVDAQGKTTVVPAESDTVMAEDFFVSPDGSTAGYTKHMINNLYVTPEPRLVIINLNNRGRRTFDAHEEVLAFPANGSQVIGGLAEGTAGSISLYWRNGTIIWTKETGAVSDVAISASGDRAAGTSWSGLYLFNGTANGSRLLLPREDLSSVSMSRNGTYIATGSRDGTVYLLNWTGSVLWSHWNGGTIPGQILDVGIAAEGSAVVSASEEHEIRYFSTGVLDVPPPSVNASATNTTGKDANVTQTVNTTTPSPSPTKAAAGVVPLLGLAVAGILIACNVRK
jgi:WD40 repeat protein